jgi:polysaccharide export outer membrane protein
MLRFATGGLLVLGTLVVAGAASAQPVPVSPNNSPNSNNSRNVPQNQWRNYQEANQAYTLAAGDRVRLDVFNVPEYTGEYKVLVDGTLNLPIVGKVDVEGRSISEAQKMISRRYARFLTRPLVTLSVVKTHPVQVSVAGEVNRPGAYTFGSGGGGEESEGGSVPTLTGALQRAGGITPSAAVEQVQIRRQVPRPQVISVNLWNLIRDGNLQQNLRLRNGDEIIIPTAENVNARQARQLANSSIAPESSQPLQVAIVGEVARPGTHMVQPSENGTPPTLTQAIEAAGGITQMANIREIEVRRPSRGNDDPMVLEADLWQLVRQGDLQEDMILQPGDRISIPTASGDIAPQEASTLASASFSPDTIQVNVVGEVKNPGTISLKPNTPLSQAILAAGGFDRGRAQTGSVELVRLQPNGSVTKREISVDFARGVDSESNPPLRNNDVIVVGRSGLTQVSDTLGNVLNPVGKFFSLFNFFRIFD